MTTDVYAFGEMLWDLLPAGPEAGGAPFNVCAHLAQLGIRAGMISRVGQDEPGDEILKIAEKNAIDTRFVGRARAGLETGTVRVRLDEHSNATYDIVQPAAWDEISVSEAALEAVQRSRALVYGSLACRSAHNLQEMERLLAPDGPLKLFDVNLRPPFADPELVLALAKRAHVLKLNAGELDVLTTWIQIHKGLHIQHDGHACAGRCAALAGYTGVQRICVTLGAEGAIFWDRGLLTTAAAPATRVTDTVGAGDAFMASLIRGLLGGIDTQPTLEHACQVGSYVASQHGATPRLPAALLTPTPGS